MSMHWARISERGSVTGMRMMLAIRRGLGPWAFSAALHPVMLWYFCFQRDARRISRQFLLRVDPSLARHPLKLRWQSYRHFASFGNSMMDRLLAWSGRITRDELTGDGVPNIEAAIASGRGSLVLVSHHGNFSVVDALASQQPKLDILVLQHTKNAVKFNRVIAQVARHPRPPVLEVSELTPADAQRMARCIESGGFVVIAADRLAVSGGRSQEVSFLGSPAPFSEGPFRIATLLRCPIHTLDCVKRGRSFQVDFEPFDDTSALARHRREAWIKEAMQRYADHLGERARRDPLQWYNFFPFWRETAAPDPREDAR
ncbi:glycosyl transferase [Halotalea alkalilenta]|uniref:LpxL/LpxP family acyltransferase n=1 Tax=Halotalea alkalilenta TaxID=376489 RepID=UPI0005BA1812|nr:glycosyl transferase [Halotalea alkalilenta]